MSILSQLVNLDVMYTKLNLVPVDIFNNAEGFGGVVGIAKRLIKYVTVAFGDVSASFNGL